MSDMRSDNLGYSPAIDITGKIMVVVIIILFVIVVTFVFFHLYAKGIWWSNTQNNSQSQRPQQRGGGLDPALLKSLPVTIYQSDGLELMECAVCLSEIVEGEKVRILGKCNHGFHVDCIDMWFHSHSTCPLCRTTVEPFQELQLQLPLSSSSTFPTNVLIWGNHNNQIISSSSSTTASASASASASLEENKTSSSSSSLRESGRDNGILIIDIPNDYECEVSSSSTSTSSSPSTGGGGGGGGRLRSLKRLLSSRGIMSLNPWTPTSTSTSTDIRQAKPAAAPS